MEGAGDAFALTSNRYFDHLLKLGYALHVHQSNYLDFCSALNVPVSSCSTYKSNSIGTIAGIQIPTTEKSRFMAGDAKGSNGRFTRSLAGLFSVKLTREQCLSGPDT